MDNPKPYLVLAKCHHRLLGIILIVVGLAIITGVDKSIEAFFVENGWTGITEFEEGLTERFREA